MSEHNGLTLDYVPCGRNGQATLTARLNGEPVALETLNLTKGKDRAAFVAKVCDGRPGIDAKAVEAELLRLAAELASKTDGQPAALDTMPELDVSAIVHPERLIHPDVSGVAVPTMTAIGESPTGRWLLYLRWADGKREYRPMPHCLDLPEGRRLCDPSEPIRADGAHAPRLVRQGAKAGWRASRPPTRPKSSRPLPSGSPSTSIFPKTRARARGRR